LLHVALQLGEVADGEVEVAGECRLAEALALGADFFAGDRLGAGDGFGAEVAARVRRWP